MSNEGDPDVSGFDPLKDAKVTEEEKQEKQVFLNQSNPPQAGDSVFTSFGSSPTTPTSSFSALQEGIAGDGQTLDPITEAIRKEILEEQRKLIRIHLQEEHKANSQQNPDLSIYFEDDEKFKEFLKTLNADQNRRILYDKALENADLKKKLEAIELAGYKNIHDTFSADKYQGGFRSINWDGPTQDDVRSQVVKNGVGDPICTLTETTHNTNITVRQGDKDVTINSYRTVDFPVKLEGKSGTMHLSMVALDENGQRPPIEQAVYFTAHYEATPAPNGTPKLKEVSSPQPLKFLGEGTDAVGYVEHGGKIYTLPVTRGKYQEMMQEVALNQGQSVDVSQTIAEDQFKVQEQTVTPPAPPTTERPIEYKNTEIPQPQPAPPATSINTPKQPEISQVPQPQSMISSNQVPPVTLASQSQQPKISQMPQPQQAESFGMPNQAVKAATELSQAMQGLLEQLNKDLKNEVDKNGLIGHVAEKILQNKEERQAGINALSENILKNEDLAPDVKVQGVGAILKTINDDNVLSEPEKAKLLEGISAIALNANNLEKDHRQKILENVTDAALKLSDEIERWKAVDSITQSVIDSNLNNDEQGNILVAMGNKVRASELELPEKNQLISDILDKGKETGILTPEQQQLMQQNSDKIIEKQAKEEVIAAVQGILYDPIANKTASIKDVTIKVLDGPAKAEVKGEIIESVAEAVANSNADLEVKKQMTTGLVDGIESKAEPVVKPELTNAVISGVDKSTATPEDKNALKDAANEAILKRETQNLDKDLGANLYGAARGMTDALKDVFGPAIEALEKTKESVVSQEEKIAQKTSDMLSDASNFVRDKAAPVIDKASSLRNILSSNSSFKTAVDKQANSEQQINKAVEDYKAIDEKYKPQYEQQQGSYDTTKESQEKKHLLKI